MYHREIRKTTPEEIGLGANAIVEISAVHFTNQILLHLRLNGELDTTYEVVPKGLPVDDLDPPPIAGTSSFTNDSLQIEDEDYVSVKDNLSNYHVVTRLGDSNDMKLPIVCTQIAELYQRIITPSNIDGFSQDISKRGLVITMSAKIWRKCRPGYDFHALVFILQSIKEMYNL
ncbi:LAFE_0A06436g1_1 [Lachancea fermentati]|uniref:LAFE_0A06436g1_1 n=1 Tax=Lachancea fermentati TaxID=4955 RepID=A0A1G4M758_LACFM|nr:LAFE_0A06436g1_1 [Lachancea fermentati]